jgi:hypothetical protein
LLLFKLVAEKSKGELNLMGINKTLLTPNIATKQISKPSVAIMVETHLKLDTTTIKVDN